MTDVAAVASRRGDEEIADLYSGYPGFIIAASVVLLQLMVESQDSGALAFFDLLKHDPRLQGMVHLDSLVAFFMDVRHYIKSQAEYLSFLVQFAGTAYWLFCIYRMHAVLAAVSGGSYPISARRAVGLQLIPIFNLFWSFVWLKALRAYIKNAGVSILPDYVLWVAVLLGLVGGQFFPATGLTIIFSTLLYLRQRLRKVLPPPPRALVNAEAIALSAAAGCAFGALLLTAVVALVPEFGTKEILTILMLATLVAYCIEPLIEHVRVWVGLSEAHPDATDRPVVLRVAAFFLIALASMSDGLLHSYIHEHFSQAMLIAMATTINFGITWAWIQGVRSHPSRAALLGLITGGLIAAAMVLVLYGVGDPAPHAGAATPAGSQTQQPLSFTPGAGSFVEIGKNALVAMGAWSLVGFVGGFVLDRRWGRNRPSRVLAAVVAMSSCVIDLTFQLIAHVYATGTFSILAFWGHFSVSEFNLWAAIGVGWAIGILIAGRSADAAFRHVGTPRMAMRSRRKIPNK